MPAELMTPACTRRAVAIKYMETAMGGAVGYVTFFFMTDGSQLLGYQLHQLLQRCRRAVWGMLYAHDSGVVPTSPRGLARMMGRFSCHM